MIERKVVDDPCPADDVQLGGKAVVFADDSTNGGDDRDFADLERLADEGSARILRIEVVAGIHEELVASVDIPGDHDRLSVAHVQPDREVVLGVDRGGREDDGEENRENQGLLHFSNSFQLFLSCRNYNIFSLFCQKDDFGLEVASRCK